MGRPERPCPDRQAGDRARDHSEMTRKDAGLHLCDARTRPWHGSVLPHGADFNGRGGWLDGAAALAPIHGPREAGARLDLDGPRLAWVLEVTREIVDNHDMRPVSLLPGDYLTTPFGTGSDRSAPVGDDAQGTRRRGAGCSCARASRHGTRGLVVVSDVFFDDDAKNSPPFALSFALNMMLTTPRVAHAKTEMARWLADTGS